MNDVEFPPLFCKLGDFVEFIHDIELPEDGHVRAGDRYQTVGLIGFGWNLERRSGSGPEFLRIINSKMPEYVRVFEDIERIEIELNEVDWASLRDVRAALEDPITSADYVPVSFLALVKAHGNNEAEKRYWELENHIVVQGQTFEAAEYLIPALVAALSAKLPEFVLDHVLELMFQIVAYGPHQFEIELGNHELTIRSREKARKAVPILYEISARSTDSERELIKTILGIIEPN